MSMSNLFYLYERHSIGWRRVRDGLHHWPRRLGGFVGMNTDGEREWREWDTPQNAVFRVVLPGGRLVLLTRRGEVALGDATKADIDAGPVMLRR